MNTCHICTVIDMELFKQQKEALSAFENFLKSDDAVFILKGYAGTGKTTLISHILEVASREKKVTKLMAPTGRAAKILGDKTAHTATTIHRAIYELSRIEVVEGSESEESKVEYRFPLRQLCDSRRPGSPISPKDSLIIVDEASMIGSRKTAGELFLFGTGILLDDILKFARLQDGGKILFVGDPAQLPPVGDTDSFALDVDYFLAKECSATSFELTDVVRQDSDSTILKNSIKLRQAITSDTRSELILDRKDGEVEDLPSASIARKYCELSPIPSMTGPVVICHSNKSAAGYNDEIRSYYYPDCTENIQCGDRLIVVANNYSESGRDILNGEFAIVVDRSDEVEVQTGFVYVKDENSEEKKRVKVDLMFRDVTLLFDDGTIVNKKLLETLLNNTHPNVTYQEQCALMSNFNIRNKGLKPKSSAYMNTLMSDPYYNAVRAKYGYAITGHKSQGGEWDVTFVDFKGRTGMSKDCLRWSYTAATRARKVIYADCLHRIPQLTVKVVDVTKVSNAPTEYFPVSVNVPAGPYHSSGDMPSLKAKYWQVSNNLNGTGFKVCGVEHQQYREIYAIGDSEGNVYKCAAVYNKAGILRRFSAVNPNTIPTEVLELVNVDTHQDFSYEYTPSSQNLEELYTRICSICDENNIAIVNVVEHLNSYKVAYYLKTDAYFAYLDIYINKFGQVTYIAPRSEMGNEDMKLVKLIEGIRQ